MLPLRIWATVVNTGSNISAMKLRFLSASLTAWALANEIVTHPELWKPNPSNFIYTAGEKHAFGGLQCRVRDVVIGSGSDAFRLYIDGTCIPLTWADRRVLRRSMRVWLRTSKPELMHSAPATYNFPAQ